MTVSSEVVALIAAAVSVFAAVVAVRATAVLARTMLADDRRPSPPPLTAQVLGGQTRRGLTDDTRDYSFTVALTNHTRSDRQASAHLRVTYRTRANFLGAVDLDAADRINVPAGQTVDATLRFTTSNVIPRHCRVDAYSLLLADEQGERLVVDASLQPVLQADTDGLGPKNWGWD